MKKELNYAFIDGQNLNLGIRSLGWKLDYKAVYQNITENCQRKNCFYGKFT